MSTLTDTLIHAQDTLLASGQQIPATDLRAFTSMLIGAIATLEARARGNDIIYTNGVPATALGLEGDLAVNKLTGDFFAFTAGQWDFLFNGMGRAGVFTPIAATGTHPAFADQDTLNAYLLTAGSAAPDVLLLVTAATLSHNTQDLTYSSGKMYSSLARQLVLTNAPEIKVRITSTVRGTISGAGLALNESAVMVYVGGVFQRYLIPNADHTPQDFTVTLPGTGPKSVVLTMSSQSRADDTGDIQGTIVQQVSCAGTYTLSFPAVVKKPWQIAALTDSIGQGIGPDLQFAYLNQLRDAFGSDVDICLQTSYGGKRLWDTFQDATTINDLFVNHLDGQLATSATQRIYVAMTINDKFKAQHSPADLTARLGAFCDAAFQRYPNVVIVIATPTKTVNGEGSNGLGTADDYAAAMVATRTTPRNGYVTIADLRAAVTPSQTVADGVHLGNSGNTTIANLLAGTALFGSIWKDVVFPFADADVLLQNMRYSTTARDGAFGHRALANQYNPAGEYISLQMQYTGPADQNFAILLHDSSQRVTKDQARYSLYVNSAGKLVLGWRNPTSGAYEVLSNTVTATAGYYYVLNRNNVTNAMTLVGGPDKTHPNNYTAFYSSTAAYSTVALYPGLDLLGASTAGGNVVQVEAARMLPLPAEGYTPPPATTPTLATGGIAANSHQNFTVAGLAGAPCVTVHQVVTKTSPAQGQMMLFSILASDGTNRTNLVFIGSAVANDDFGVGLNTYTNAFTTANNVGILDDNVRHIVTYKLFPNNPGGFQLWVDNVLQPLSLHTDQGNPGAHANRDFTNAVCLGGVSENTTFDFQGKIDETYVFLSDQSNADRLATHTLLKSQYGTP